MTFFATSEPDGNLFRPVVQLVQGMQVERYALSETFESREAAERCSTKVVDMLMAQQRAR